MAILWVVKYIFVSNGYLHLTNTPLLISPLDRGSTVLARWTHNVHNSIWQQMVTAKLTLKKTSSIIPLSKPVTLP